MERNKGIKEQLEGGVTVTPSKSNHIFASPPKKLNIAQASASKRDNVASPLPSSKKQADLNAATPISN